jgi:hypothetical protein
MVDADGRAALTTLTAFLGAVIGFTGCLAGALTADAPFTAIAALGGAACGCIWYAHLERDP